MSQWADEIDADARAQVAVHRPGGRPAKGYVGRNNLKLLCSSCGFTGTCSRAALQRGWPACCGAALELPNLRDRIAIGDPDALAQADREAAAEHGRAVEAEAKRAQRDAEHGFSRGAASCGVCGRFKSKPADRCGFCGDYPVDYGAQTPGAIRERERIVNRSQGYSR